MFLPWLFEFAPKAEATLAYELVITASIINPGAIIPCRLGPHILASTILLQISCPKTESIV